MIDSHVHLHRADFATDRAEVLARAAAAGVSGFLEIGYDPPSCEAAVRLAGSDPRVLAAVGIHPHDAAILADAEGNPTAGGREVLTRLRALAAHPRVVAIGEIGLDYYRDLSPRPAQHTALTLQLELAAEMALPVVFHIRDAYPQTRALVEAVGIPARGAVLHSFAGDRTMVEWAREHGLLLGIGGPVTYKKSALPTVLEGVSPDGVLLETDAPWLPPVPYRGKRNEPAYLVHTRDHLAGVLGTTPDDLNARTDANFARLFGRMPTTG